MEKVFAILILAILVSSAPIFAQMTDTTADTSLYVVIDVITLLLFLVGVLFAVQLYIYMKGGSLMSSWRWLTGAILLLAIVKILEILQAGNIFPVQNWLIRVIYLVSAIFMASGFYGQKKALS
jgi:hypothetical protein